MRVCIYIYAYIMDVCMYHSHMLAYVHRYAYI